MYGQPTAAGPPALDASSERTDRQLVRWLGTFLFAYYLLTLGGHQYSIDGIVAFQAAKSMLFRQTLLLDPPVRWGSDIRQSFVGIGVSLAYIPALLLFSPVFAWWPALKAIPYDPGLQWNPLLYGNLPYLLCSWLNGAVTAATGCLVFRLGCMLGLERGWALAAALAFGLASPAADYARYDFGQPLAMLALTTAVYGLLRAARGGLGPIAVAGTALGYAILTRREALVFTPLAAAWIYAGIPDARPLARLRRLALLTTPVALAIGIILWTADSVRPERILEGGPAPIRTMFPLSPVGTLVGMVGLLVSPARGLLLFFPLAWLALPGLVRIARSERGPAILLGGFLVVPLVMYGGFYAWWGSAWCWGPRYLVLSLPILSVAAAAWAAAGHRPSRRALFVALAAAGFIVSLNGILFDPLDFSRWMIAVAGLRDNSAVQFRLVASPIATGWLEPRGRLVDIVWLRLFDVAPLGIVTAMAVLLGWLALAGWRLTRLSRSDHPIADPNRIR